MSPAKNSSDKSGDPKKKADEAAPAPSTPSTEVTPAVPTQSAPNHDDTDVAAALQRTTQDGKGEDPVPPADFDSYATEGVEQEDKSDADIAHEVLEGKWGYSRAEAFAKLRAAGLDAIAISDEVKRLQDSGKPSTLSD